MAKVSINSNPMYTVEVVGARGRKMTFHGDLKKLKFLFSSDLKKGSRFNKEVDIDPSTPQEFIRNLNMAYGQSHDYSAPYCARLVL